MRRICLESSRASSDYGSGPLGARFLRDPEDHVAQALVRFTQSVECVDDTSVEPDNPISFRVALVLESDVAGNRRGDGVKRGGTDRNFDHDGKMGAGRASRQRLF
jgi:hypothetical protein